MALGYYSCLQSLFEYITYIWHGCIHKLNINLFLQIYLENFGLLKKCSLYFPNHFLFYKIFL